MSELNQSLSAAKASQSDVQQNTSSIQLDVINTQTPNNEQDHYPRSNTAKNNEDDNEPQWDKDEYELQYL